MNADSKKKILVKAFSEAVSDIFDNPGVVKFFVKDFRPTNLEKDLLKSMDLLRDGKFDQASEEISSIHPQDPFVKATKLFVLGVCSNQRGEFNKAIYLFKECDSLLEIYDAPKMKFLCDFNHFFCFVNLQKTLDAEELVKNVLGYDSKNLQDQIKKWRVGCIMALAQGHLTQAEAFIHDIEKNQKSLSESQRSNLFYDKFQLYIQKGELNQARELVREMKSVRKFYYRPNYLFMKGLLDFIIDGTELYLYEKDFKGNNFLWWQISVIKNLQAKELGVARQNWSKLQAALPHVYDEDFVYHGQESLFKMALREVSDIKEADLENLPVFETKEELLAYILEEYPSGILKDDLYRMIYGEEVQSKADYDKLKNLVKRIRKKVLSEIKSRKGSYYLAQSPKKAS